jgi:predicted amidohydrolase YtcJ
MPSLVLYNGKFVTQDSVPLVTAVAIRDGRFLALGDAAQVRALAGLNTRSIDLGGRLVLPGLADAHFHYRKWAISRRRLSLTDTASLRDLCQRLAQKASEAPPGRWILATGWNENHWLERRLPGRADLDEAVPAHPVILWRYDGHLAVANSRALEKAGITCNSPDPLGGVIDRDESGQPTGILRDLAIKPVSDITYRRRDPRCDA